MSARVSSSSSATSLASAAICFPVKGFVRPSWVIASIALASPIRKPKRAPWSRYGACDIDSMPPATPTSRSPSRTALSTSATERIPEAQTLFTVSDETSFGMPALICAWREGICPCPAWRTWPMTTCSTWSGATSARSRAASIALPPSSVASSVESPPPSFPNGVRAVARIAVLAMWSGPSLGRCGLTSIAPRGPRVECRAMPNEIAVSARQGAPEETTADTRVVGLFEGDAPPDGPAAALVESGEAKPAPRKLAVTHEGGRRLIVVGLGKREEFDAEGARVAAAVAAQRARELGARSLSWAEPNGEGAAGGLVEGTLLALYRFNAFKKADDDNAGIESLEIASGIDQSVAVENARVRAVATNRARDLQNTPSNIATPEYLAGRARELAGEHDALSVEVFGRDEIEERGMGAFAAVASGSDAEPRLI